MNKKKHYLRFKKAIGGWLSAIEAARKDALEILKDGPVDLAKYTFGQQPYHFISVQEDLYCHQVYLDGNGFITIDAGCSESVNDAAYELCWDDMSQDIITLSDFMDCIYDNEDCRYDDEEDN